MTIRCVLSAFLLLPVYMHAQVDGWNKGKGNMDLVLSAGYEIGFDYYLAEGQGGLKRNRGTASFFAARGITNDLDVQLNIPFGVGSFQDGNLFLKWLPLKKNFGNSSLAFGAAVGGSTPLADYNTEGINAIGQQASSVSALGIAQFRGASGWFTSVVAGQTAVKAPTPDALIGTFRVGRATGAYFTEVYLQGQRSYGGKNYRGKGDEAPTTFRELGVDFLKVGAKYYRPLGKRLGWVVESNYNLLGRNVDRSVLVAGSIILHFRKRGG